jgi:hypothetical protein
VGLTDKRSFFSGMITEATYDALDGELACGLLLTIRLASGHNVMCAGGHGWTDSNKIEGKRVSQLAGAGASGILSIVPLYCRPEVLMEERPGFSQTYRDHTGICGRVVVEEVEAPVGGGGSGNNWVLLDCGLPIAITLSAKGAADRVGKFIAVKRCLLMVHSLTITITACG